MRLQWWHPADHEFLQVGGADYPMGSARTFRSRRDFLAGDDGVAGDSNVAAAGTHDGHLVVERKQLTESVGQRPVSIAITQNHT